MLAIIFSLKRVGRVGPVNKCYWDVIKKTSMFTITNMFLHVFLHAWYAMRMFARVRSIIIPPIAKNVNCLIYTLFSTFVTSKEINKAFLHAVKPMINFVSFSCNRTDKTVRLINICTNLATWSFTIKRPYWSFNWIQLSSYQVTADLPRNSEGNHRTWCKKMLKLLYNRYKLSWIIFPMILSKGWYVTTNGTPFSNFVLWKTPWPKNLTLLFSVSIYIIWYISYLLSIYKIRCT